MKSRKSDAFPFHARVRRRKRGTLALDRERLKRIYDEAPRGKRLGVSRVAGSGDPLLDATGDPLVRANRSLAMKIYGVSTAARPNVALRRLNALIFGDNLSSVADMAIWFQQHRGWSIYRSAAEAATLAAERDAWIGALAPVSFDKAVDLVRAEVRKRRARERYSRIGWTGRYLYVYPMPGRTVRIPANPRETLPSSGARVPDDLHWRRRLHDGDVSESPPHS